MFRLTFLLMALCFMKPVFSGGGSFEGSSEGTFDYDFARGLILEHQFSRGEAYIRQSGQVTSQTIYLEALSAFLQYHLDEHIYDGSVLNSRTSEWVSHLEGSDEADALFSRAAVLFFSSFTHGRYGNYVSSVRDFNKAYRTANRLKSEHPQYAAGQLMHGVILVLFGSIPENYRWLLRLMNIPGDVDKGLKIIHNMYKANRNNPAYDFHEEHLFFLAFSYRNFGPGLEALEQVDRYYEHPRVQQWLVRSPMVRYSRVMLLKDLGRNDEAIQWMERPYRVRPEVPFLFLDAYIYGLSLLEKMDYRGARVAFTDYLNRYSGQLYRKSVHQKLAWIGLLSSGEGAYRRHIDKVGTEGSLMTGADKGAQKEYEWGTPPNPGLLKTRLLFDGGYYDQAMKELMASKPSQGYASQKDDLEHHYRLARIYDKMNLQHNAITYYAITIEKGAEKPWYFAANAALMMGELHLRRGEREKAKQAFEKCLTMNPESYKESIHQKAKARLNTL